VSRRIAALAASARRQSNHLQRKQQIIENGVDWFRRQAAAALNSLNSGSHNKTTQTSSTSRASNMARTRQRCAQRGIAARIVASGARMYYRGRTAYQDSSIKHRHRARAAQQHRHRGSRINARFARHQNISKAS